MFTEEVKITIELAKSPFSFYGKIKDTLFNFTNNFSDLDTSSVLAISCVVEC